LGNQLQAIALDILKLVLFSATYYGMGIATTQTVFVCFRERRLSGMGLSGMRG